MHTASPFTFGAVGTNVIKTRAKHRKLGVLRDDLIVHDCDDTTTKSEGQEVQCRYDSINITAH